MADLPAIKQIGWLKGIQLGLQRRWRPVSHLQIPAVTLLHVRKLSDDDLLIFAAGWKPGSAQRLVCDAEIKRREGRTARLALAISFCSLVVALGSAIFSQQ